MISSHVILQRNHNASSLSLTTRPYAFPCFQHIISCVLGYVKSAVRWEYR